MVVRRQALDSNPKKLSLEFYPELGNQEACARPHVIASPNKWKSVLQMGILKTTMCLQEKSTGTHTLLELLYNEDA